MNPWKILGVHRQMTQDEIREVYVKLARKYHPDVARDDRQQFSIITGAYALLKDVGATTKFIKQMKAVGKDCERCKGKGATFRQRGMGGRIALLCHQCGGSGIILKKEKEK